MGRGTRLKILLGACIVGMIGVVAGSKILIGAAVVLLLFSGVRYPQSTPTNYTEKFGPPDPEEDADERIETPFTQVRRERDPSSEE